MDRAEAIANFLDSAPIGIFVIDRQGRTFYTNAHATLILGQGLAEDSTTDSLPQRYRAYRAGTGELYPAHETAVARALRGESVHLDDIEIHRPDGIVMPIEATAFPIRDEHGEVVYAMAAFRDITERRRAEAEHTTLEFQLRTAQKLDALGRLAGGVAHDFNNLLTVINGTAELLLSDPGLPEATRRQARTVLDAGERAAKLTGRLLQFGRAGGQTTELLPPDSMLEEMGPLLARVIGEGTRVNVKAAAGGAAIRINRSQLEQVIMNLTLNARDAMGDSGTVTIETAAVELDASYVATHFNVEPGSYVMLAVSDTGEGMDAPTRERIFEPFYSTKGASRGNGLGLATVYSIAREAGGSIWLYSEPGKGSTFKIYFPRVAGAAATPVAASRAPAGGRESVVVLEDDPEVRGLIVAALERYGYAVREAADVATALALCAEGADLLVTDVVLTGESGRDAADRARAANARLRVLFMSGYTDEAIARHGVLEDGVAFIQKPFALPALAARVREVLDRKG